MVKMFIQAFQDAQTARNLSTAAARVAEKTATADVAKSSQDGAAASSGQDKGAGKGDKGKKAPTANAGAKVAVPKQHVQPLPPLELEKGRGRPVDKEHKDKTEREDGRSRSPKDDKD